MTDECLADIIRDAITPCPLKQHARELIAIAHNVTYDARTALMRRANAKRRGYPVNATDDHHGAVLCSNARAARVAADDACVVAGIPTKFGMVS